MSTFFTTGFAAIALAVWFTLSAWGQVGEPIGQGVPSVGPIRPSSPGTTEPKRPVTPPKSGDPIRDKVREGAQINAELKAARDGDLQTTREAREDVKARAEAQLKADEARARAARVRDGVETARDRAEDARVRAEVVRDQDVVRPAVRTEAHVFRPSAVRSADIGLWFDRTNRNQLIVSDVATRGPIAKLGFREGDRIVSVNGQRAVTTVEFMELLFAEDLRNERVEVVVSRDGREFVAWVEPSLLIEDYYHVDHDPIEHFGIIVDDRYEDRIVVWRVLPQSPAFYAGIRPGDQFVTFRGDKIGSRAEFVRTIGAIEAGEIAVQVRRDNRVRDFRVDVPAFVARTDRRVNYLKPEVDRLNERREERIEQRREVLRDRTEARPGLPGVTPLNPGTAPAAPVVPVVPVPAVPAVPVPVAPVVVP